MAGIDDDTLRSLLESASSLFRLVEEPPPSLIGLERRADADRERLQAALRSAGHYDATITIAIDDQAQPVQVTVTVAPGPVYRFQTVTLVRPDGSPLPGAPIDPAALGLVPGEPARAPDVVAAQDRLTDRFGEHGHAFARVTDRRVVVDHDQRTMDITYTADPGPLVRLGAPKVEGLEQVKPEVVLRRLPWQPGERYDPELMARARTRISDLGVFDSVRIQLPDEPPADAGDEIEVPVTIAVTERKRRFIGAGINFSTDQGFGTTAYWGHRNLLGGAEQLTIAGEIAGLGEQGATSGLDGQVSAEFRKPDFLAIDQTLILSSAALVEKQEAYDRTALMASAGLERILAEGLTARYGLYLEESRVTDNGRATTSTIAGLPASLTWDATDNLLNPTRGFRVAVEAAPYVRFGEVQSSFLVTRLTNSAYYDIADDGRYVLAGRLSVGSIFTGALRDIPADKRFYAGGGGSIRGYGFQMVGPLDADGDPTGGRSLFELSAEFRIKVTDTIGIVPFINGGNVYDSLTPEIGKELRWGAGLGMRYYTGFGPLRVDIGVPLNRRPIDDTWQLYLSLGQAF